MKRLIVSCSLVIAIALVFRFIDDLNAADKKDEKAPATIKQVMAKAHKQGGALPAIAAALKSNDVKWESVESKTKDLLLLAGDLSLNKPPKGEQASWDKLCKEYLENVQSLEKAVKDKSAADALASQKALSTSCKSCHSAHKK